MTVITIAQKRRPLSVGVTVDLERAPNAGGHVKSWERFAEAATYFPDRIDLTVYLLAFDGIDQVEPISPNARFRLLPPRRGTRALRLRQGGGHTDLAGRHLLAERLLPGHDLLHATASFALSRSAAAVAQSRDIPLMASVHTDLPAFAHRYAGEVVHNFFGRSRPVRALVKRLGLSAMAAGWIRGRVHHVLRAADHLFHSNPDQAMRFARDFPHVPASRLRRGIDRDRFDPVWRDRIWLGKEFGVPADATVLLFAGRIDPTKNVMVAVETVAMLHARGVPVHFLAVGEGADRAAISKRLGGSATLPGAVSQTTLARLYASSDLFVFPSETETFGNVVLEAMASGLPVAVRAGTAPAGMIRRPGLDGLVIPSDDPQSWAAALMPLIDDTGARREMSREARETVMEAALDWQDVFETDLLQVWETMMGWDVLSDEISVAA